MSDKVTTQPRVTDATAQALIEAARGKALEIEVPMCISVCDPAGVLKGFARMDGAAQLSIDIAQEKAQTAIGFGMPTHEWYDFIEDDPPLLHGIAPRDGLIIFGGGYPLMVDGQICGGIGVSGGHYSEDMEVAEAAIETFENL